MTYDTGSYDIIPFNYNGVELQAPKEFCINFDEKKLRAAGFG